MQSPSEQEIAERVKIKEQLEASMEPKDKDPFYLRIQKDPTRLKRFEKGQQNTFNNLIKNREHLKHLKDIQIELFYEYFMDFLKGEVVSINDFFYEDCKDTSAKGFFELRTKLLKTRFAQH